MSAAAKLNELDELNAAIAERRDYYEQQEKLINELVETGNATLRGLEAEILLARRELKDLKLNIRISRVDYRTVQEDLVIIQAELDGTIKTTGISFGMITGDAMV